MKILDFILCSTVLDFEVRPRVLELLDSSSRPVRRLPLRVPELPHLQSKVAAIGHRSPLVVCRSPVAVCHSSPDSTVLGCGSNNLTIEALKAAVLHQFNNLRHVPIWKQERPESIRGDALKIYKIYPVGLTQRQALYEFHFGGDADFRKHIETKPCSKFEVVFV